MTICGHGSSDFGNFDESKYFPDPYEVRSLSHFDMRVKDAILDLERRVNALEEREFKYSVLLLNEG